MATTETTVRVELTGMEPFKTFIRRITRADELIRTMTEAELAALPTTVVRGFALLQEAMAELAPADGAQAPVAEHVGLDDATIDRLFPDSVRIPVDPHEEITKYSLVRATLRTLGAAGYTLVKAGAS